MEAESMKIELAGDILGRNPPSIPKMAEGPCRKSENRRSIGTSNGYVSNLLGASGDICC